MREPPVPVDAPGAVTQGPGPGDWRPWLASALAVLAVVEVLAIFFLAGLGDERFQVEPNLPTVGFVLSILLFPAVGALVVQRRPATRVAWLMIAIGIGFGLTLGIYGYGTNGVPPARPLPFAAEALVISQLFFVPLPGAAIAVLLLLFPTDRLPGPRWRLVVGCAVVGSVVYGLSTLLDPGVVDRQSFPAFDNPFRAPDWVAAWIPAGLTVGNSLVTGSIALGAASLAIRYRRADPVESAQIRWIALVAAVAAPCLAVAALQLSGDLGGLSDVAFGIGLVVLSTMPIAIGIAISRYRLYEIDRLINRALVYGTLTAILAGVFTAAIGLAQRVFVAATGQTSDAAIVLTTLVVATLYAPLRKRLEQVVDRRFKYEEHRFGPYRDEIRKLLSLVEPGRAARRLVTEAVAELEATGGAVVDSDGSPRATAGTWPVAAVVRLPIPGTDRAMDALIVGPRIDGRPHDPRSVVALEDVVRLLAVGLGLRGAERPRQTVLVESDPAPDAQVTIPTSPAPVGRVPDEVSEAFEGA